MNYKKWARSPVKWFKLRLNVIEIQINSIKRYLTPMNDTKLALR